MVNRRAGLALLGVAAASALLAYQATSSHTDYPGDAGDPIDALIHGRLHQFLASRPVMGPFSLILRAPFAALGLLTQGSDPFHLYNDQYRFGIFPSIFIAGLLGIWLARIMAERGRPLIFQILAIAICVVSPPALRALDLGHPEEILGGALAAGAVVAGLRGKPWIALVLLAFTVANKQWGILAVVPVALTLDTAHLRRGAYVFLGIFALFAVPLFAVDASSLLDQSKHLLDLRGTFVLPADVWWPFTAHSDPNLVSGHNVMPTWLAYGARPFLIAACVAVPLAFARRVRANPLERVLPLLALVLLLRCMLDPLDNSSYHAPFMIAVVAADAFGGSFVTSLVAIAALWLTPKIANSPDGLFAVYMAWTIPMAVHLGRWAYGAPSLRIRAVRGPAAAR